MNTPERVASSERQLMVFRLGVELYGADISSIREIIRMQTVTPLPKTSEFVEGMISLRGKICPVVDLRKRFDVTVSEATDDSRIVLMENDGGDGDIGVIVDAVAEVIRVSQGSVTPLSRLLRGDGPDFVEGIVSQGERLIILVDLQAALGGALVTGPNGEAAAA